ncbi:MAG: YhgE/Pip domain-containing protein [Patescibacteria group bacterium]
MKISAIVKRDLRTNFRSKIKLLSLVVAVLLPLAYGFLYLWAFWNPYENMKNIPVAVVNEDTGVIYNDNKENYGDQIVKKLKENDVLDWRFVEYTEAQDGLDSQKYYAIVRIPADFSAALASADDNIPRQASITWQTHDSTNFLFTTYFKNVMAALGKNINEEILPQFSQVAQTKLDEASGELDKASEGADQLASGLGTLKDGSNTLDTNLQKAADGSGKLADGLGELNSKSQDLNSGIAQAKEGSTVLETGLKSADSGMASLDDGLGQLSDGAAELKSGSSQLADGTDQLTDGANEMSTKVASVDEMLSPFYPFLNSFSRAIDRNNAEHSLDIPNYVSSAKTQKDQLVSGSAQIADGADTIAENMSKLDTGIGTLQIGIGNAKSGADTLSNGITQLTTGQSDLRQGLGKISDGSVQYTGGVNSAYYGSKELSGGLAQLADGSKKITNGLTDAESGANALSLGLSQGTSRLKNELTPEKIDMLVKIINEPIKTKDASEDANATYGAGFAPYFIPLALWMGALILMLLVPTRDPKLNMNGVSAIEITLGKFFLPAIVGIAQAVALAAAIIFGLGLKAKYPLYFVLFCILISLACISIMQFLSFVLGKVGELFGIIILMIQLTSASGTFPVESAPRFFQLCNPLVPMTYAIRGLRLFILGGQMSIATNQALALCAFILLFLALKMIATKKTAAATDIYPLIEL